MSGGDIPEGVLDKRTEDPALSLTLAVVQASVGPLLLLDGDLHIVVASRSFARTFGFDFADLVGRSVLELGAGEWKVPDLRAMLDATVDGQSLDASEFEIHHSDRGPQCVLAQAERLSYADLDQTRVVLALADITAARADEKLRREIANSHAILLQEVRHRVANSLQIVAGVLLRSARSSRSTETRGHLEDAHNRIMSVAALERQLSGGGEEMAELASYLANLCENIAASMIPDRNRVSVKVVADVTQVDAALCTSSVSSSPSWSSTL